MPKGNGYRSGKIMSPNSEIIPWLIRGVKCRDILETEGFSDFGNAGISIQHFFHIVSIQITVVFLLVGFILFSIIKIGCGTESIGVFSFLLLAAAGKKKKSTEKCEQW